MTAATDTERMTRALDLGRVRAGVHLAEPVGGLRRRDGRRPGLRGGHAAGRRTPRRGRRARRRPGRRCRPGRRHGLDHPRAVLAPRAHPALRRRAGRRRRRRASWWRIEDPDPQVAGAGHRPPARAPASRSTSASRADAAADLLAPYLMHRRTGRPYVVLKLAASLDGRTAAPDGSSQWITGAEARADAHALRAESDAVLVGAGTVRADDPDAHRPRRACAARRPRRASCSAPRPRARRSTRASSGPATAARPARRARRRGVPPGCSWRAGPPSPTPSTAPAWSTATCSTSRPVLFGGDDARGLFAGPGAPTIDDVWRGAHPLGHPPRRRPAHRPRPRRTGGADCSPASSRSSARSSSREGPRLRIAATHRARRRGDGRLDRGQRLLPHRRRLGRRRLVGGRRRRRDLRPHRPRRPRARAPGEPRAARAAERPPRRPPRAGPRRRRRRRSSTGRPTCGSACAPTCSATSSRRGRSPSTASASPSSSPPTTASPSPSSRTPHEVTTLGHKGPGDPVNLEVDVTAKYVERLLSWKDG